MTQCSYVISIASIVGTRKYSFNLYRIFGAEISIDLSQYIKIQPNTIDRSTKVYVIIGGKIKQNFEFNRTLYDVLFLKITILDIITLLGIFKTFSYILMM